MMAGLRLPLFLILSLHATDAFLVPHQGSRAITAPAPTTLTHTRTIGPSRLASSTSDDEVTTDWRKDFADDNIDIEAVFKQNKDPLPAGPRMVGLKRGSEDDEEKRKSKENNRLNQWLADNGVHMSDKSGWGVPPHPLALTTKTIDESEREDSGRGLVCKETINQGNSLFYLPMTIVLDKEKAVEAFGADIVTDDLNEYFAIALLLIHEKSLGERSFFSPYISVLPTSKEVNPTLIWSESELDLLKGSNLLAATYSLRAKLEMEYDMLKGKIFDKHPDKFPANVFTWDNYLWAFINIFSRAIRVNFPKKGERIIMCPYADMINHNPYANTYIVAERSLLPVGGTRNVVTIYADKDYKRFEQVYISYGPKSNADLLLLYGFCLDRNPFNSVELRVGLTPTDPLYEMKKAFLKKAERRETELFPLYADRYPNELFEFLRLVFLKQSDLEGKTLEQLTFADPLTMENELSVLQAIEDACLQAIASYPTTEDEDSKVIGDTKLFMSLSKSQRMAIKHCRSEKRLLKKTAAAVRQQSTALKTGSRPLRSDN